MTTTTAKCALDQQKPAKNADRLWKMWAIADCYRRNGGENEIILPSKCYSGR